MSKLRMLIYLGLIIALGVMAYLYLPEIAQYVRRTYGGAGSPFVNVP